MYAIIETGSKQYRVQEGDTIDVELLGVDQGEIQFDQVLLVSKGEGESLVGSPSIEGWLVKGEVLGEAKGPKVVSFKFKRRQNYRRKIGHRQRYSRVKITGITG